MRHGAWCNSQGSGRQVACCLLYCGGDIRAIPLPNYTEGPWLDKRGKTYYIIYPSRAHQGYGEHLDYASAPSPEGPWTYRGRLTGGAYGSYTIHPGLCRTSRAYSRRLAPVIARSPSR